VGNREQAAQPIVKDHLAVMVTNQRVLAFSAFTGGFFSEDLRTGETIDHVDANDNIVILKTPFRQLVFRSQMAVWAELR